jgi:sulfur carrier protein
MILVINGEEKEFEKGTTLAQIIDYLGVEDKVMALAVNMQIVKKDKWSSYAPQSGDKLELLEFVGGG